MICSIPIAEIWATLLHKLPKSCRPIKAALTRVLLLLWKQLQVWITWFDHHREIKGYVHNKWIINDWREMELYDLYKGPICETEVVSTSRSLLTSVCAIQLWVKPLWCWCPQYRTGNLYSHTCGRIIQNVGWKRIFCWRPWRTSLGGTNESVAFWPRRINTGLVVPKM